jgi:hypothetical protein
MLTLTLALVVHRWSLPGSWAIKPATQAVLTCAGARHFELSGGTAETLRGCFATRQERHLLAADRSPLRSARIRRIASDTR